MQTVIRVNKICAYCGKEFTPNSNNQKFCSAECFDMIYHPPKPKKTCKYCGKEFIPWNKRQITCGDKNCINEHNKSEKAKRAYSYKRPANEALIRKKKRCSKAEWNNLTPCQRWELMTLTELSGEVAGVFPGKSFGHVRLLKEQGKLPDDFGKKV